MLVLIKAIEIKLEELEVEEISIYSFKPIRSTEQKKYSIGVSQTSKILIDATIPFQIKPWE